MTEFGAQKGRLQRKLWSLYVLGPAGLRTYICAAFGQYISLLSPFFGNQNYTIIVCPVNQQVTMPCCTKVYCNSDHDYATANVRSSGTWNYPGFSSIINYDSLHR